MTVDPYNRNMGVDSYDDRISEALTAQREIERQITQMQITLAQAREGLKRPVLGTDDLNDVPIYGPVDPKAQAAYDEVVADYAALTDERAGWVERRQKLQDEKAKQPGEKPLTKEQRDALDIELQTARSEASSAASRATVAGLEAQAATAAAAAAADPANQALAQAAAALDLQVKEATLASTNAGIASQALRDSLAVQAQAIDTMLAPYKARSAAAQATSDEAAAALAAAEAEYAPLLAEYNALLQGKNVDWQELQNAKARLEIAREKVLQAGGEPELDVEAKQLANEGTATANQQVKEGAKATAFNQIFDALERGAISPDRAWNQYQDVATDSTRFEREKEASANANNLLVSALNSGTLVRKGTTSMDPSGGLAASMRGAGAIPADMRVQGEAFGDFARSAGVDIDPNTDPAYARAFMADLAARSQQFRAQGQPVPAGYTQGFSGAIDLSGLPPEQVGAILRGEVPPPGGAPLGGAPQPDQQQVQVQAPTVATAGGPPATPAPPTADQQWQAGVEANPVLKAASTFGQMIDAEPHPSGLTKISYADQSVRWFDAQGAEQTEPQLAPPPAQAPAAAPVVNVTVQTPSTAAAPLSNGPEPWDTPPPVVPTGPPAAPAPPGGLPGFAPQQQSRIMGLPPGAGAGGALSPEMVATMQQRMRELLAQKGTTRGQNTSDVWDGFPRTIPQGTGRFVPPYARAFAAPMPGGR